MARTETRKGGIIHLSEKVSSLPRPKATPCAHVRTVRLYYISADRSSDNSPYPTSIYMVDGRPAPWLQQILQGRDVHVVQVDIKSLEADGPVMINFDDPAAVALVAAEKLGDASAEVRHACLELVARDRVALGKSEAAVAALCCDPVWYVRRDALTTLARLLPDGTDGSGGSSILDLLYGRLSDGDDEVRGAVVKAFRWADPPLLSAAHLEALANAATSDGCRAVREVALSTLGRVAAAAAGAPASSSATALQAITACLRDGDGGLRAAALEALGVLGADAITANATLVASIGANDPLTDVREAAERVLSSVPPFA